MTQHLSTGRLTHVLLRCLGVFVLLAIATVPPRAQTASSSDLRVSVMVARACTVSTGLPTAETSRADSLVSVRCADGATPATPRVSVLDEPTPLEQQEGVGAESSPATNSGITVVVVNF